MSCAAPRGKIQLLVDVVMAGEEDWKERAVRSILEEACTQLDVIEYLWASDCNRYIVWVDDRKHGKRVVRLLEDRGLTVTRVMYGDVDMTGGEEWKSK